MVMASAGRGARNALLMKLLDLREDTAGAAAAVSCGSAATSAEEPSADAGPAGAGAAAGALAPHPMATARLGGTAERGTNPCASEYARPPLSA